MKKRIFQVALTMILTAIMLSALVLVAEAEIASSEGGYYWLDQSPERPTPTFKFIKEIAMAAFDPDLLDKLDGSGADQAQYTLRQMLENNNYGILDVDLNKDAGGDYIYMGWNYTTNPAEAITGLKVKTYTTDEFDESAGPALSFVDSGVTWYLANSGCHEWAPKLNKDQSEPGYLDLNDGAGGKYVFLYVTKDAAYAPPISNISYHCGAEPTDLNRYTDHVYTTYTLFGKEYTVPVNFNAGLEDATSIYLTVHTEFIAAEVARAKAMYVLGESFLRAANPGLWNTNNLSDAYEMANTYMARWNGALLNANDDRFSYNSNVDITHYASIARDMGTIIQEIKGKIYFNGNGGTATAGEVWYPLDKDHTDDIYPDTSTPVEVDLGQYTASKDGYEFLGWSTDKNAATGQKSGTVMLAPGATLYAIYKKTVATVSFDANGHGTAPASYRATIGNTITKPAEPTAFEQAFGGWYKEAECINAWDFENDTIADDIRLYAKWTSTHVHEWPNEWTVDETAHWHECLGVACTDIADWAEHSGSICSICGYLAPATLVDGIYQIGNAGNLVWFAELVNNGEKNANAILTADIDMTGIVNWVPIGNISEFNHSTANLPETGYHGTFDGNGFVIRNLTLDGAGSYVTSGIFGTLSGSVKKLGVDHYNYVKTNTALDGRFGAIAGLVAPGGIIEDCYVINSTVDGDAKVAGVIAGANYAGTIRNCFTYNCEVQGYEDVLTDQYRYGWIVGDSCNDGTGTDSLIGTATNCYTDGIRLSSTQGGTENSCLANVASVRFTSGEIAYFLNAGRTAAVWGQKPGNDALPTLGGEQVIRVSVYRCDNAFEQYRYENGTEDYNVKPDHTFNADYKCTVCTYQMPIILTVNGETAGYDSIADAVLMSDYGTEQSPAILTLLDDIVYSADEYLVIYNSYVTLDLNGKTLTLDAANGFIYLSGCNFTLKDSSPEQTGVLHNKQALYAIYACDSNAVFESGKILVSVNSSIDLLNSTLLQTGGYIQNDTYYCVMVRENSSFIQNGGTMTGRYAVGVINSGEYILNDGTLTTESQYPMLYLSNNANIEINGGTFYCDVLAYYQGAGTLTVNGGTFTPIWDDPLRLLNVADSGTKLALCGGSFEKGVCLPLASQYTVMDMLGTGYLFYDANGNAILQVEDALIISEKITVGACVHTDSDINFVCDACTAKVPHIDFSMVSLTLNGDIGVNFFFTLDDVLIHHDTACFLITYPNGETEKVLITDDLIAAPIGNTDGKTYYKITARVAAKEMTDDVKVALLADEALIEEFTYNVQAYATVILADPSSTATLIDLVKSMLNYGAAAQITLGYRTDALANSVLSEADQIVNPVDASTLPGATTNGSVSGFAYQKLSCILETTITLRQYFTLPDGSASEYTFTVNGTTVIPTQTTVGGIAMYYIDIANIAAKNMGEVYELVITNGEETRTITCSVYSYIKAVLATNSNDVALVNAIYAMYAYNQAAIRYVAEN